MCPWTHPGALKPCTRLAFAAGVRRYFSICWEDPVRPEPSLTIVLDLHLARRTQLTLAPRLKNQHVWNSMDPRTSATTSWLPEDIGRRGMGLRIRLLVSSRARLTLGDCVLTVDSVALSSMVAAILCLMIHSARSHPRFDEHRNCLDNEVSSYPTLPALCPLQAAAAIPLTRISRARPSHIDYSSHRPLEAQHRSPVYPPWPSGARKISSALFARDNSIHCSGCRSSFRQARTWYTPHLSSV